MRVIVATFIQHKNSMKILLASILASIFATGFAVSSFAAEPIALRRGLPTDIWTSWPMAADFDDPKYLEIFPEYRQEYKGHEFALAKKAGFDFIRLTIDPAVFLWNANETKTAKLTAGLKIAIAEIRDAGLKVVVDLHSVPRVEPSPGTDQVLKSDASFEKYLTVVEAVGLAIADLPAHEVAFEPMNEPTLDCVYDLAADEKPRWPAMLVKMHGVARKAAPQATIILSGGCWGGADGLAALDPKSISDQNVIWSFHSYEPFLYTHQGASWTGGYEAVVSGIAFPPQLADKMVLMQVARDGLAKSDFAAAKKTELDNNLQADYDAYFSEGWALEKANQPFEKVSKWAKVNGIPSKRIILGEFGARRSELSVSVADPQRIFFYKLVRSNAEAHGWAWSTWAWSSDFGVSRTTTSRDFSPLLMEALGLNPP